jgi:hypothetical protein
MRCRLLPSHGVSLEGLSRFVVRYCARKRRRGLLEDIPLRRLGSSSFTRGGREPIGGRWCRLLTDAQREISIMTVVSAASCRAEVEGRGRIG